MRLLSLLLAMAVLPVGASAQSLGDAARKEEERRQRNKEKGVRAPVFDDSKIAKTGAAAPAPAASPSAAPPAAAALVTSPVPSAAPTPDAADVEAEQRKQQEELWRDRMATARARRDAAKNRYDEISKLLVVPGESYVDDDGRIVIRDVEHLRELLAKAKADWKTAEQAISDLEDAARRAGALPGWLR